MNHGYIVSFTVVLLTIAQCVTVDGSVACGGKINKCLGKNKVLDPPPDSTILYGVRCCSEDYFFQAQKRPGCSVWSNSKNANKQCSPETDFEGAQAFCAASGARLCTCSELLNKCAKGTGCGLNKKLTWCTSS